MNTEVKLIPLIRGEGADAYFEPCGEYLTLLIMVAIRIEVGEPSDLESLRGTRSRMIASIYSKSESLSFGQLLENQSYVLPVIAFEALNEKAEQIQEQFEWVFCDSEYSFEIQAEKLPGQCRSELEAILASADDSLFNVWGEEVDFREIFKRCLHNLLTEHKSWIEAKSDRSELAHFVLRTFFE